MVSSKTVLVPKQNIRIRKELFVDGETSAESLVIPALNIDDER